MNRVMAWFSCGVTSAVAAHLAIKKYGDTVTVAYIDTASEHPDNNRFLADVEAWLGRKVEVLKSTKYQDVDDVIARRRYLRGPQGAPCSGELKKAVRFAYQLPDDLQVFGFHADERKRAQRFRESNIGIDLEYPLIDNGLGHDDCMALAAGGFSVGIAPHKFGRGEGISKKEMRMQGLYRKYIITKADGSLVDPKAQYLVLRLDTDKAARVAAMMYADGIAQEKPELAADIRMWVDACIKREAFDEVFGGS
jgi:hypothetical protein